MAERKLFGKYHDLALIGIGFLLTTVAGGFIGYYVQHISWKSDNITKLYQTEIYNANQVFEDISKLMDKRLYRTRRLIWGSMGGKEIIILERRNNYREFLIEWNDNLNRNLARIHRYFGEDMRVEFENDISKYFVSLDSKIGLSLKRKDYKNMSKLNDEVNEFNPKIYNYNIKMLKAIQSGRVGIFLDKRARESVPGI